jgi:predicted RNase H-like HicB family nuclease
VSYRAVCEWDGELWYVKVPSIPGCHTQGKNLTEIQRRIREALSLFVRDAKRAELEFEFVLPKSVRNLVARTRKLRAQAEAMQAEATEQLQASAAALEAEALSYRDIGAVLDLSHQRIQQVLAARSRRGSKEM